MRSREVDSFHVDVVVPARNNAVTIASVLAAIPTRVVRSAVVVDYGSTDNTAQLAVDAGAIVLREPRAGGYGAACRRGVEHLAALPRPSHVVVFVSPNAEDDPREIPHLLQPIANGDAEMVIGIRHRDHSWFETARQKLVLGMIRVVYQHRYDGVDMFRAIRLPAMVALGLRDEGPGIAIEMQVRALCLGLHIAEVPVSNRPVLDGDASSTRRLVRGVGSTGRALYHIVRSSTAR